MVSTPRQKENIGIIAATFIPARNDHGYEEDDSSLCGMLERELRQERESSLCESTSHHHSIPKDSF